MVRTTGYLRKDVPSTVGPAIRFARLAKRWSQQRVADRSGVSRETIYRIECGRTPDPDTVMRICGVLGIRVVDLVPDWISAEDDDVPSLAEPYPGYRLRQRRRQLGVPLREAAEAAGVSIATLSRFERFMSASRTLLTPVYADDPEGGAVIENDGLARLLGFPDSAGLAAYCTKE